VNKKGPIQMKRAGKAYSTVTSHLYKVGHN
jgi:hypothetical protein